MPARTARLLPLCLLALAPLVPAQGYAYHEFPAGFSCHWIRLRLHRAAKMTAQFVYS